MMLGPRVSRPDCLLIQGETNNGKTTILKRFMQLHPKSIAPDGKMVQLALMIEAPASADEKRLLGRMLQGLGAMGRSATTVGQLETTLDAVIRNIGLKIMLIDEFQHTMVGPITKQIECLNMLKSLTNTFSLPIVCAGVMGVSKSLKFDPQLENRFLHVNLPKLKSSPEFVRLVLSFMRVIPLKREMLQTEFSAFHRRLGLLCDGKIGELHRLIREVGTIAIVSGDERFSIENLKAVEHLSPLVRITPH